MQYKNPAYDFYEAILLSTLFVCAIAGEMRMTSVYPTKLTMGNFLVRKKASVHIHGKVHHVCVTEEVQFPIKQLLLIVDLGNRATIENRGVCVYVLGGAIN